MCRSSSQLQSFRVFFFFDAIFWIKLRELKQSQKKSLEQFLKNEKIIFPEQNFVKISLIKSM